MLSNFQEHFQHLQHLSFYSYFSGLQRKLPLASLGYSHPRRYNHMASIRQANCYLEILKKKKQAKKINQYAFYKAWLPEFDPQNLHGRTRNTPKKAVPWPLYAPCSTNTLPRPSNKWDPVSKEAVGVLEGNVLDCSLASTCIYMHICIFTRTHTQKKKSQTKLKYHHHSPETTFKHRNIENKCCYSLGSARNWLKDPL